jgi:hypothetical protein
MTMERIYNVETGETTELPLSAERVAALAEYQSKVDAEQAQADKDAAAKQIILDRLGLTAEEAALLLK